MTIVMAKPTFPPYVCIDCGMQSERKWFVDLQLQLDNHFNPVLNGVVYLCDVCFESRVLDTMKQVQLFEGANFGSGEAPTYENKEDLLEEGELNNGNEPTSKSSQSLDSSRSTEPEPDSGTVRDSSTEGIDFSSTGVDQSTPTDQPESTDDSDGESEPLHQFRAHFGKQ